MMRQGRGEIRAFSGVGAIAALLVSCAPPLHPSGAAGGAGTRATVEHASADDCAIIAEIGKAELHWSAANAPEAPLYPVFATPGGGTYLEDCPWKKLDLAEPSIGTQASPIGFFVTRPVYSTAGASAWFQYSVGPVATAGGKQIAPFIEQELCVLDRHADGWHLIRCKMTAIT